MVSSGSCGPEPDSRRTAGRRGAWLPGGAFRAQIQPGEARAMSRFQPRLANPPGEGRRRRVLYTVYVPAPEPPAKH
jgi:hypothetical protein